MKLDFKKITIISLGIFIMAVGLYFFLIPADLATGGVTGLAMVLNYNFPNINIGTIMTISNLILFILGFLVIGKDFGGYTIYASFLLSGMIYIFELIFPMNGPLVEDLMLNLIYGILIQGVGMGIIFSQNASTGGTDIVAKIINKFTHIDIGKALLIADFIIFLLASYTFGLELGLYALLGIIINAFVIDNFIENINSRISIVIISDHSDAINKFILDDISRGTTLYDGGGGYSKSKKTIISTVVNKKEYIIIREFIKEIDPYAFITVGKVNEVFGDGFKIH